MEPVNVESHNGWRFCPSCKNLLKPYQGTDNPEVLLFKCRNKKCGQDGIIPVIINPSNINDQLLIKKDYQAAKAIDITDNSLVLDPSMPRKKVICRKCGFNEAIYFMKTDKNEKEIIIQYICANKNPKICGEKWTQYKMIIHKIGKRISTSHLLYEFKI